MSTDISPSPRSLPSTRSAMVRTRSTQEARFSASLSLVLALAVFPPSSLLIYHRPIPQPSLPPFSPSSRFMHPTASPHCPPTHSPSYARCPLLHRIDPTEASPSRLHLPALHDYDPVFRSFSRSEKMKSLAASLGFRRPLPVQSMYIFKVPFPTISVKDCGTAAGASV